MDLNIDINYQGDKLFVFREGNEAAQIFIVDGEYDGEEITGVLMDNRKEEIISQAEEEQNYFNNLNRLKLSDVFPEEDIIFVQSNPELL